MAGSKHVGDEEFMRWCESVKPCRHCGQEFVGPVCECERPDWLKDRKQERPGRGKKGR